MKIKLSMIWNVILFLFEMFFYFMCGFAVAFGRVLESVFYLWAGMLVAIYLGGRIFNQGRNAKTKGLNSGGGNE